MMALMVLIGCGDDVGTIEIGEDSGSAETVDTTDDGPGEGGPGGDGPEQQTCEVDEDCEESCMPEAVLGCVCHEETCALACETDDDCPDTPEGDAVPCDTEAGICTPPGGPQ